MGAQTDRLRCEVFQNLILSPINTGFLRHAVATALTVYGIETFTLFIFILSFFALLQQPLPFTVLKQSYSLYQLLDKYLSCNSPYRLRYWNSIVEPEYASKFNTVATVLTVYGIETLFKLLFELADHFGSCNSPYRLRYWNEAIWCDIDFSPRHVATALTVYGIETQDILL